MKLNASDEFVLMVFCIFNKCASLHMFSTFCFFFLLLGTDSILSLLLCVIFYSIFTTKPFYTNITYSWWFTFALHDFAFCCVIEAHGRFCVYIILSFFVHAVTLNCCSCFLRIQTGSMPRALCDLKRLIYGFRRVDYSSTLIVWLQTL